jgi:GxxExxY protein
MINTEEEVLTGGVIGAAIEVHKALGPGLLESAYKMCLMIELKERNIDYKHEMMLPIKYKGHQVDFGFRVDLLIENEIVVELKSVEQILPVHEAQLLTYMRLLNKHVGLLINFNVPILKRGIKRLLLE